MKTLSMCATVLLILGCSSADTSHSCYNINLDKSESPIMRRQLFALNSAHPDTNVVERFKRCYMDHPYLPGEGGVVLGEAKRDSKGASYYIFDIEYTTDVQIIAIKKRGNDYIHSYFLTR